MRSRSALRACARRLEVPGTADEDMVATVMRLGADSQRRGGVWASTAGVTTRIPATIMRANQNDRARGRIADTQVEGVLRYSRGLLQVEGILAVAPHAVHLALTVKRL